VGETDSNILLETINDFGQISHSSINNLVPGTPREIDTAIFNNPALNEIQWEHWLMGSINPTSSNLMIELENLIKEISSKVTLSNLHPMLLARSPNLVKAGPIQDYAESIDNGTVNDLVRLAVRLMVHLSPWGASVLIMVT